MQKVIGVTFKSAGHLYYFDPEDAREIKKDDKVIVETVRGVELAKVVLGTTEIEPDPSILPIKPIIRIATAEDIEKDKNDRVREREAFKICAKKIREHGLDMKLIDAEYTFDDNKILFYFISDGRIDFRNLVKDLAAIFKIRIELRQIGVRDAAKIVGGLGPCGRELCCAAYMTDFTPVSIKMAKEQNLSLNPGKISGSCGRLMCCLANENDIYKELNKNLPSAGDKVTTPDNLNGKVQSVNVLRQRVRVIVDLDEDDKEVREYHVSDIKFTPKKKAKKQAENNKQQEKSAENKDNKDNRQQDNEPKNNSNKEKKCQENTER